MSNKLTRRKPKAKPGECHECGRNCSHDPWMAMHHPTDGFVGVKLKMALHDRRSLERAGKQAILESGLFHEYDHAVKWTFRHEDGCEFQTEGKCWCGPVIVPRSVSDMWDAHGKRTAA